MSLSENNININDNNVSSKHSLSSAPTLPELNGLEGVAKTTR